MSMDDDGLFYASSQVGPGKLGPSGVDWTPVGATDEGWCSDDDERRAALARHGYPADLPARGVTGRPDQVINGYGLGGGRVLLRNRVCELDGIEIDGHEGSGLDPGSTSCIHCDYEGPNP